MTKTIVLLLALTSAAPAFAQNAASTDVVVMRRQLAPPAPRADNPPAEQPAPTPGAWHVGDPVVTPGCSATQPAQAPVTCRDTAGNQVSESRCTGQKPTGASQLPNYSTCTYSWSPGLWSGYSSDCSAMATRTRTVSCLRSDPDHTAVEAANCDPNSPDARTTDGPVANYSGCTYTPTYSSTYGACVNGTKSAPIVSCKRSDGTVVPNAQCGADKQVTTQSCSNCADPANGMASSGPRIADLGGANSAAQAGNACRQYLANNPSASGICIWDPANTKASLNSGALIVYSGYWGSTCTR